MRKVSPQMIAALLTMYIVWGTTYIAIAYCIETLPPLVSVVFRFLGASALLAIFIGFKQGWDQLRISRVQLRNTFGLGALMLGNGLGIVTLAERYVPVGITSLLIAALPLWIALFRTISGDRPKLMTWVGVAVGFIGVALLLKPGEVSPRPGQEGANVYLWMAAIIFGNLCWAFGTFRSKSMDLPKNTLVTSTYEMFGASFYVAFLALASGESFADFFSGSLRSYGGWVYLIVMGSVVGYTVFGWLTVNAPISLATTYAYVNPVVAVILAIILLNEKLTTIVAVGGFIVVLGVATVVTSESAKKHISLQQ